MEEKTDTDPKVARDQEKEPLQVESSSTSNGLASSAVEVVVGVTSPPPEAKDDTSESTDEHGAASSEPMAAGASALGGVQVASDDSHVFHENWSELPKDEIVDRVKGVIYGQAIGDAFGK